MVGPAEQASVLKDFYLMPDSILDRICLVDNKQDERPTLARLGGSASGGWIKGGSSVGGGKSEGDAEEDEEL